MNDIRLIANEGDPNPDDKKVLVAGLLRHHASKGHFRKSESYSIFLKDSNDKVLGGIIVTFLWNGMEINSLWVDESLRGQGWGQELMYKVEKEAIKRGCTLAHTNTFSWQAPDFYAKLGYTPYGKLENFPLGNTLTYYFKRLS